MLAVLLLAGLGCFAIGAIAGMLFGAATSPGCAEDPLNRSARTAPQGVERFDGYDRGVDGDALYRSRCRR